MHRIQAQAIEAVFEEPHQGVVDKEVAHFAAAKVDPGAPGGVGVFVEKALGVLAQVIAVGAEVVVDHIEDHRQAMLVGTVDQLFQLLRRAQGRLRCIGQYPVVTPIALAGILRQGHQFDGGDAQFRQARQVLLHRGVAPEYPHMQLVDHRFMPGPALPGAVAPGVGQGVDHHAVTLHTCVLAARGRVRHIQLAIDVVVVAGASPTAHVGDKPALCLGQHGHRLTLVQLDADIKRVRCP